MLPAGVRFLLRETYGKVWWKKDKTARVIAAKTALANRALVAPPSPTVINCTRRKPDDDDDDEQMLVVVDKAGKVYEQTYADCLLFSCDSWGYDNLMHTEWSADDGECVSYNDNKSLSSALAAVRAYDCHHTGFDDGLVTRRTAIVYIEAADFLKVKEDPAFGTRSDLTFMVYTESH
jgi:hypothetical protein